MATVGNNLFPPKLIRRSEILGKLTMEGVIIVDPETTFISPSVTIGRGTVIYPGTVIWDKSGNSEIGRDCQIGPFSYLREHFTIGDNIKIGFLTEVVRSSIGDKTKVPHWCHIGDAIIGRGCNIAAGVIFCNYDGSRKSTAFVEDHVFIGSGSMIVPPVRLEEGSFIAAGSVITKGVPPKALAIARARQEVLERFQIDFGNSGWQISKKQKF